MHLHARALHNCINWLRRSPAPLMCLRMCPPLYQREVERILALPPVPGEITIPSYLAAELALDWPARRQRLPKSQRDVLEYLESETRRRASVAQQDLEPRFGSELKSIYWRLEALCCLGFTKKEVTNFRGSTPTYNYRLSDQYRSWLERQP